MKVRIPYTISEYLHHRFRKDFLFEIKKVWKDGPREVYVVEVSQDGYIYTINLDQRGQEWHEDVDAAFAEQQR